MSDVNGELDGTVGQGLFADTVPILAGFQLCFFDRVHLKELIQQLAIAPGPVVIVHGDRAGAGVADDRVSPARQLHSVARCFGGEEREFAVRGLGVAQSATRSGDGSGITYFSLYGDDV